MRWLFLFVFALNLVYVAWGISQPPADPYANVQPLKNVMTIVLLSEAGSAVEATAGGNNIAQVEAVIPGQKDGGSEEGLSEAEVEKVSSITAEANVVTELEAAAADRPLPETEVIASVTAPVELSVQSSAEPSAESPVESSRAVNPEKELPANKVKSEESVIVQTPAGCYTLGPFRDLAKLRRLTRDIKSYVVSADFRGKEENEQPLYWVYIKPEKNRKAAIATGKRLKAKKIKDFYVIREGEKINGLSLGYFRSKDGATGLVKKVDRLGFDVVLEPVYKTYTVYWLDFQLADDAKVPESVFAKYIADTKKDKVKLVSRDCGD